MANPPRQHRPKRQVRRPNSAPRRAKAQTGAATMTLSDRMELFQKHIADRFPRTTRRS